MDCYVPPEVEQVCYVEDNQRLQAEVRETYGQVAKANNCGASCGNAQSCCGVPVLMDEAYALELGYTKEDLQSLPEGSNMGLGCGNPQTIAALQKGERVLDLGSGGGIDVFLAARRVGNGGRVYGVDMTPDMVAKSRVNADKAGFENVEFLLGEIEHLPLPDRSVDVVISNCVVNLSVDKARVFREAFRVLDKGGRVAISDMVAIEPLPPEIKNRTDLHCACIAGAPSIDELKQWIGDAGFVDVKVSVVEESKMFVKDWAPGTHSENYVLSAKISAMKP